jgi:hypothetical protein
MLRLFHRGLRFLAFLRFFIEILETEGTDADPFFAPCLDKKLVEQISRRTQSFNEKGEKY